MTTYYLITFASTHLAIRTERMLKEKYKITMIPTPRDLSASCGLSLMLEADALDGACAEMAGEGFEGMQLYHVTRQDSGSREYQELEWRC